MTTAPTILVVEDNPTTRKMLRLALQIEGYQVVDVPDGRSALAEFARRTPDLVLQDLILPDMDGLELVRGLRALPGGGDIPILALSGFVGRLGDARTAQAGFTGLLVKPIEPSRLVEALHAYLPLPQTPVDRRGAGRRILLVDDDQVQLKLSRLRLAQAGFQVATAGSAQEGLAAARAGGPEVILSDVLMPDLDGFEFCLALRREPGLASIPVVLLSSQYRSQADQSLASRVGATALVARTPELTEALRAVLAALASGAPIASEAPGADVMLAHAQAINQQLERQLAVSAGLAQRCSHQAAQLSLLSGVAEAVAKNTDPQVALRDVLAATLDAAGISKGALFLRAGSGLTLSQAIGFSDNERQSLGHFFGCRLLLDSAIERRAATSIPSTAVAEEVAQLILAGAGAASVQVVPLVADGRGVGAIVLAAKRSDVTSEDAMAFARAMGNQMVQSLELAESFARLTASEARYRTFLETANDAIAVMDLEGNLREVNRRWEEILGVPRDQIVGHNLRDFLAPGQATLPFFRAPVAGPADNRPTEIRRADGTVVPMEFVITTLDLGDRRQVFSVGRDVTDRVRANEQLMVSDRMASVGLLAAGVAHEINNPLAAAMANLDMAASALAVLGRQLGGTANLVDLEEMVKDARQASERVRSIVKDLRIFSRAEEERAAATDVHRVLDSSLRMAWNEIRHRARLVKDYGQVPMVMANESRLGQVFLNLVVNAAQAISEGHADAHQIRVRTGHDLDSQRVLIEIIDSGPGIPPEVLARLFTPFFTTKPVGVGTGLGLAICRRIVTGLGGDISIDSKLGRGTTVRVLVPVALTPAEPLVASRPQVPAERRGRILVVDDEPLITKAVHRFLGSEHEVVMLGDGQEALTRLNGGERFDVIVCDLMMPTMTGMDLHAQLTQVAPDQAARMVFLTGGAFTPRARAFLDDVPNLRLEKPFEMQALRAIVSERLRQV